MAGTGMGLSQQMRQKQVLAPQMRQSLEVLQLQVQDLCQLAQQELEQTPPLEEGSVLQDSIDAAREQFEGAEAPEPDFADEDGGGDAALPVAAAGGPAAEPEVAEEPRGGAGDAEGADDFDGPADDAEVKEMDALDFGVLAELDDADYLYQEGGNSEYNPDLDEKRQFMFDSIPVGESLQDHLLGQLDRPEQLHRARVDPVVEAHDLLDQRMIEARPWRGT